MNRKLVAPAPVMVPVPAYTGKYFYPLSLSATSTGSLSNGSLRLAPWLVTSTIAVDRIGCDVTAAGDVGAKFRIGVYGDNGSGYPGALVLDAGQVAADGIAVVEVTGLTLTLPPGLYWIGGATQSTSGAPTLRTLNVPPVIPLPMTTSAPATNVQINCYTQGSVTGALPSNFSTSVNISSTCVRLHMRGA